MLRGNTIAVAIAVVVGCALFPGAAVAADGGCPQADVRADGATLEQASRAVLCVVNSTRAKRGLPPLRASRLLTRSARRHSRDMVARRYFSHFSLGGTDPRQRILRVGYLRKRRASKLGETIAWGIGQQATPAGLVRSFISSRGHRRVMLDRRYRDVGVGLVLGAPVPGMGDGATLTLDFGRR